MSLSLRATIGGRLRFDFSTTRKRFCPGRWGQGVGCVDAIAYYTSTKKTHGWLLADRSQLEQAVTSKRRRLRAVFRIVTKKGERQEIPGHRSRGWRQPRTREVSSLAKGWLLADPGWRARDNDPHGPSTSVRVVLGGISCRASSLARRTRFGRSDRFPFALPLVRRANSIKNSFRRRRIGVSAFGGSRCPA